MSLDQKNSINDEFSLVTMTSLNSLNSGCFISPGTNVKLLFIGNGLNSFNLDFSGVSTSTPYLIVSGDSEIPGPETHIISVTPSGFASTTSPVEVTVNFYNSNIDPALFVRFELWDLSVASGVLWRRGDSQISWFDGTNVTYSNFFSAYPAGDWELRTYLYDSEDNILDSSVDYFIVTSDSSGFQNFIPSQSYATTSGFYYPDYTGATVGTSTLLDTTNFLSFLNVPQLLQERLPFSYVFQTITVIRATISSTTAGTIPTGTVNFPFPNGHGGTTTIPVDFFSTTTITYFLTPTYISLFRGLMVATLYISFIYFLYHDARSKKHL